MSEADPGIGAETKSASGGGDDSGHVRTDSTSRAMIRHVYTQSGVFSDIDNLSQPEDNESRTTPLPSVFPDRPRNRFYEITRQFSSEILSVFEEEDEENGRVSIQVKSGSSITYEQIQNFLVSFPLILIPGLIFVHSFYLEMCLFIYLTVVISVANDRIIQNNNPKFFSKLRMLLLTLFIVGNVILVNFVVYPTQKIYKNFIFLIDSRPANFAETVWMGFMVDFVGKLMTLFAKSLVIFLLHFVSFISIFRKGKILSVIEHVLFCYRNMVPTITLWVPYFLYQDNYDKVICFVLLGIVFVFKFFSTLLQIKEVYVLSQMFCCKKAHVGRFIVLREEEKNDECSVCREEFVNPVKLECGHIFCYECICHWIKKDKTCPLCRKPVLEHRTFGSLGETCLIPLVI